MFDDKGQLTTLGGIENYILGLAAAFEQQQWQTHLVQPAKNSFNTHHGSIVVHGVNTGLLRGNLKKYALSHYVKKLASKEHDIVIFATDTYAAKMPEYKTIGIQHGISWDKPKSQTNYFFQLVSSFTTQLKYLSHASKNNALVCVDHNFVNWYRTWCNVEAKQIKVIYNFYNEKISLSEFEQKWDLNHLSSPIRIIISRRFVKYRGIKLIAPVMKKLLAVYDNIEVCFAGEGPLKPYLQTLFNNAPRVSITQYEPNESFEFHKKFHIAVIPTLGSEGTSLSMIEAMAAGCAIVSTNVGGLSNLIINGYNGLLTMPSANELENAIETCINQISQSKQLALKGIESIEKTCAKTTWDQDWIGFIKQL